MSDASTDRVSRVLSQAGLPIPIILPESARTAQLAADTLGCTIEQIGKSIVLESPAGAIVCVLSGNLRVSCDKVSQLVQGSCKIANAQYVRQHTGYAIGGVSPIALPKACTVLLDRQLKEHTAIWIAAGGPSAVAQIAPQMLAEITLARWENISE